MLSDWSFLARALPLLKAPCWSEPCHGRKPKDSRFAFGLTESALRSGEHEVDNGPLKVDAVDAPIYGKACVLVWSRPL